MEKRHKFRERINQCRWVVEDDHLSDKARLNCKILLDQMIFDFEEGLYDNWNKKYTIGEN